MGDRRTAGRLRSLLLRGVHHEDVITNRLAGDGVGWLPQAFQRRRPQRPFQHDAPAVGGQRRLHQLERVGIGPDQFTQQPHLLFHDRRVGARGMHGVDDHGVRPQAGQQVPGVAVHQRHPFDDRGKFGSFGARPRQRVTQEIVDLPGPLQQRDLRAQGGEQKRVAAESRGGIHDGGNVSFGEAGGPGQRIPARGAGSKPIADGAVNEVESGFQPAPGVQGMRPRDDRVMRPSCHGFARLLKTCLPSLLRAR
jgi:hypothetical protein